MSISGHRDVEGLDAVNTIDDFGKFE